MNDWQISYGLESREIGFTERNERVIEKVYCHTICFQFGQYSLNALPVRSIILIVKPRSKRLRTFTLDTHHIL
jgi:hypothetical protein